MKFFNDKPVSLKNINKSTVGNWRHFYDELYVVNSTIDAIIDCTNMKIIYLIIVVGR